MGYIPRFLPSMNWVEVRGLALYINIDLEIMSEAKKLVVCAHSTLLV